MKRNKVVNVGLYARLSKDDIDSEISDSIENQIEALTSEAIRNGWNIYDTYEDDGYTGLNMNRPDFQRLRQDIIKGNINTILVKNQSRIGRDNAEVDIFLNKFCIEYGVRVIGITDSLDNMNKANRKTSQINGLVNEWYSEDVSNNVRLAQDSLRLQGKFIGAHAPYGYNKDPDDKHRLIVDEDVRPIIERIFDMYLNGNGYVRIAKTLNAENIPCPSEHKKIFNYNRERIKKSQWSYHTVRSILQNDVYAGHMVQKKTTTLSYKSDKRINIPEDEQIKVLNTHEAIIEQSKFDLVQDMMSKNKYTKPTNGGIKKHLFAGLVYCAECGRAMRYRNDTRKFNCNTYTVYGSEACSPHVITLEDVYNVVFNEIKRISNLCLDIKLMQETHTKYIETKNKTGNIKLNISKVQSKYDEIEQLQKKLIEKYIMGKIEEDIYDKMIEEYTKEKEEASNLIKSLESRKDEMDSLTSQHNNWNAVFNKYVDITKLDIIIVNELIDKIIISEDNNNIKSIHIDFKYSDPFIDNLEQYKDVTTVGWYDICTKYLKDSTKYSSNIADKLYMLYNKDIDKSRKVV